MPQRRPGSTLLRGLILAFVLASPVALLAQTDGDNGGNGVGGGSLLAIPTLGPLGLVGLAAGIAGAGILLSRRNRNKNRKD